MHNIIEILALITLVSFLLFLAKKICLEYSIYIDTPKSHSTHLQPIPACGGLIIFFGFSIYVKYLIIKYRVNPEVEALINFIDLIQLPVIFIIISGILGDFTLNFAKRRLAIQTIAVILFIISLNFPTNLRIFNEYALGIPFTENNLFQYLNTILICFGLILNINLYNFIDGTDGLVAIISYSFFTLLSIILYLSGLHYLALAALGFSCSILVFLMFNWPPAKIFFGDLGSYLVGFIIGAIAIYLDVMYKIPIGIWIIATMPCWFDSSITIIRRALNKQNIFSPHKLQAFHRLKQANWSKKHILFLYISLSTVCTYMAYLTYLFQNYIFLVQIILILMFSILYVKLEKIVPIKF